MTKTLKEQIKQSHNVGNTTQSKPNIKSECKKLLKETLLDMPIESVFLNKLNTMFSKQNCSFFDVQKPIVIKVKQND